MNVPSGGAVMVRSMVASLALGLLIAPGCNTQETGASGETTKAPPNPAPRADLGVTVEPRVPRKETRDISNAEKDLHKDLGSPVIKPDTTPATPAPPPAGKPDATGTGTGTP